ncbi:hypothetical protein PJM42_0047 [Salmonella phage vB_SenP_UTK0001]|nr:hypothetical protein PJM42_0047 [Salmonella phage vB_SenP_UTK0001]
MSLTSCQEQAAKQFLSFLCTPMKHMVISGPPGVGKTFMLNHMIDMLPSTRRITNIMGVDPINNIAVTATTNKAAEVLQERFSNRTVSTIHSTLGLTVRDDYRTGKTFTAKGKNFTPLSDTLILMDESSMADTQLLKLIDEGTAKNCKIVFIGDHCQLAPVSETMSPVFNSGYITSYLNTQMRTNNSPALTLLNDQLRQTVETGVFRPIIPVPGVIDFVNDDEMRRLMNANFILQETPGHKILAYTNNGVQEYNSYIRTKKHLPPTLMVGDAVVSNNSIETAGSRTIIEKVYRVHSISGVHHNDGIPYYMVDIGVGGLVKQPVNYSQLQQAIREAANNKDWVEYFRLKNEFADLRFAYASTVHKSQGSTFDTVYIDLGDLCICKDMEQLARMLYVAASRATTRVVFYGNPPHFMR